MTPLDAMKSQVSTMLRGIERYNPNAIGSLERYVQTQSKDGHAYDLEANLALLKLYQFNPTSFSVPVVTQVSQYCYAITQFIHLPTTLLSCRSC